MIKSSWFYVKFKYNEKVSLFVDLFYLLHGMTRVLSILHCKYLTYDIDAPENI